MNGIKSVLKFVEELSQLRYCRSREFRVGAFVGTEAGSRTITGLRKELVALGMNVGL